MFNEFLQKGEKEKNYPSVASYVIGKTQLNMIAYPEFPGLPYNRTEYVTTSVKGALIGIVLGLGIIFLHAFTRNTLRTEKDIEEKLSSQCVGIVPFIKAKKSSKTKNITLSLTNKKLGTAFKESIRGIAMNTARLMEERKVLLITSSKEGEGKSTVAQNVTQALAEQGKKILLIDGNFQKTNGNTSVFEKYFAESNKSIRLTFGKDEFSNPNWEVTQKFDLFNFFYKLLPSSYDTVRPQGLPFVYCGMLTVIAENICGVRPTVAGWKEFEIRPMPLISECDIVIPSVSGKIRSAFKDTENSFTMNVSVPKGTKATVVVPEHPYSSITLNGKPAKAELKLKAGEYEIICTK